MMKSEQNSEANMKVLDDSDVQAALSFIAQFNAEKGNDHVPFHGTSLSEAITEACFAPVESRKIVALYFHNETDAFSQMFCGTLVSGEIRSILENMFYLVGWDVSNTLHHDALRKLLDQSNVDFEPAKLMISEKRAALFIIYPIENSVTVFSMLHGPNVTVNELLGALQEIEKNFKRQLQNESELNGKLGEIQSENDIGPKEFQQLMFDRLGDRDYDCFEFNEHEHLKNKIGFALFGPPQNERGYDEEQGKKIQEAYEQIRQQNNYFAEWPDQIVVSFIYNCLEPMPEEKLSRLSQHPDYNPYTDMIPLPVYVIRKCRGSQNPCRAFVDSDNRVYSSWKDYIASNKLQKSTMVLPKNGRYAGNESGQVLLERHLSPACGVAQSVLNGTDMIGTAAGLMSGGVFIAAMIPAVTVAPVVLTSAIVTGVVVGAYSVFRSISTIYDRYYHSESVTFDNTQARGAYITIVAGTLGFVGAGATTAVSHLVTHGVNIGQGAQTAINTINVINIGASGVGIANSSYQVYEEWYNEQRKPSLLTVVQLSSSILFFGNAVYHFRKPHTMIEETQTETLKDVHESMKSNRHRKPWNKMKQSSHGDAPTEIISTIRKMRNKDEVVAVLTRNNEQRVCFSADNGEIRLNGVPVDLSEFGSTQKTHILVDLPSTPPLSQAQVRLNEAKTMNTLQNVFQTCGPTFAQYGQLISAASPFTKFAATLLLHEVSDIVHEKILKILKALIDHLTESTDFFKIFTHHFSNISNEPLVIILQLVMDFLKLKMNHREATFAEARELAKQCPDFNEAEFNRQQKAHADIKRRALCWFEVIVNGFVSGGCVDEILLRELIQYVMKVITEKIYDSCNAAEKCKKREENIRKNVRTIACSLCGGYYFSENLS